MKRFSCPVCGNELHFDNDVCLNCQSVVAYDPRAETFRALPAAATPDEPHRCANRDVIECNWLVPPGGGPYCMACNYTRTVPDQTRAENVANWRALELAKRYLLYSLLKWRLPLPDRKAEPDAGLAFDFLADGVAADGTAKPVLTGHASGLITLNIAEGDDAERVARREALGEPYRTLIGHMRHEIGHFYWDRLVRDGDRAEAFRAIFGDERADYGNALETHYRDGPAPNWQESFISSYAAAHPWEDFAESWAHYTHMVDASETAHAFEMTIRPGGRRGAQSGEVEVEINPYLDVPFAALMADWIPLTVALNCLNRSIGQPDHYPFVLSGPVKEKLNFIHDLIH